MAFEQTSLDYGFRPWSSIDETDINLEKLRLLCASERDLKREGYVREALSQRALQSKLRCHKCAKKMMIPGGRYVKNEICTFHSGKVVNLHFTCCQVHVSNEQGCQTNMAHTAPDNWHHVLSRIWAYHNTPLPAPVPAIVAGPVTVPTAPRSMLSTTATATGRRQLSGRFVNTSRPSITTTTTTPSSPVRSAITLDCEFGISIRNESELLRITAIDFFTGETLLNNLVKPTVGIKNYMSRYSGVTSSALRAATYNKTCIIGGRDAARTKLLQYIDADTVIVVHGGAGDMTALRLIHPNVLDTHVVEKTYLELLDGGRSLKNLCWKRLGRRVQEGRRGHDSHEDAMACRELAIWMMGLIPDA